MSAAEITETLVGGLAPHEQTTGTGLKCGVYTATKVTQNDWVILGDFSEVKECIIYTVDTGARTAETFTIDGTTKNKVVLSSATTGAVSIVAIGY